MDHVDLTNFHNDEGFTVQFLGPAGLIAVNTLVKTLSGFNDALEAIGDIVNPDFDIEVFVDNVTAGCLMNHLSDSYAKQSLGRTQLNGWTFPLLAEADISLRS